MKVKRLSVIDYSIILFGFFPLIPNNLKGILLIALFFTSLSFFLRKKSKAIAFKPFIINTSIFFLSVLSLLYSTDLAYGWKKLGPLIPAILFPLVFYIFLTGYRLDRKVITLTLNIFTISTVIFMLYFIVYFKYFVLPLFPDILFFDINYIRSYLRAIPGLGHHPIYVGLFLGISLIFVTQQLFNMFIKNKILFYIYLSIFLFLIFSLLLISNKSTLIFLILTSIIILSLKSTKKITFLYSAGITFFILLIIFKVPYFNKRFQEIMRTTTYTTQSINPNNSTQIRIAIWKTTINCIKDAPLLGHGIGDANNKLHKRYAKISPVLLKGEYNSHNQFLGVWLRIGLIGLLVFLYFIFFNFNLSIKDKDYLFTSIILFFILNFLTENIIERQTGGTLFFFFINLFTAYYYTGLAAIHSGQTRKNHL